jgi:hypothetical protein
MKEELINILDILFIVECPLFMIFSCVKKKVAFKQVLMSFIWASVINHDITKVMGQ